MTAPTRKSPALTLVAAEEVCVMACSLQMGVRYLPPTASCNPKMATRHSSMAQANSPQRRGNSLALATLGKSSATNSHPAAASENEQKPACGTRSHARYCPLRREDLPNPGRHVPAT